VEAVFHLGYLAGAEERSGMDAGKAHDFGALHVKFRQGGRKGNGFGKPVFGQAAGGFRFQRRVQHIGARGRSSRVAQALTFARAKKVVFVLNLAGDQSSPS
jgi:hypothetical protein